MQGLEMNYDLYSFKGKGKAGAHRGIGCSRHRKCTLKAELLAIVQPHVLCIPGAMRVAVPRPAIGAVPVGERRRRRRVRGLGRRPPLAATVHAHRLVAHPARPPLQRRVLRIR